MPRTAFASADSVAREQAMLVAQLKSGQLREEEAHTARQHLAQMDHERKTQAEKLDSSGKTVDPVFNIASIEATSRLLLQKAGIGGADTTFTGSLGNGVVVMDGEGKPTGELQGSGEWALSH